MNSIVRKVRLFLIFFLFSFCLYPQEINEYTNDNIILTNEESTNNIKIFVNIDDAISLAFDNDKELKQAEYDVRIAQIQRDSSFSDIFMPSLIIGGSFGIVEPKEFTTARFNPDNMSMSSENTGIKNNPDVWKAQAELSKVFFTGFRNWNADKRQLVNLNMVKEQYNDTMKNVDMNTRLNFYNTFVAQENYRVYLQSQLNYSNRMRYTYTQYRNGLASEYEYLNAKVQYENTKPNLVTLSNQYQSLKLTFIRGIGLTNSAGDVEIIGNILDATNISIPDIPYDVLLERIMFNNIDLKNMESNIRMLEYNKKIARGYLWPNISGSAGVSIATLDKLKGSPGSYYRGRDSQFDWSAGVSLSYSLDSLLPFSSTAKAAEEAKMNVEKMNITYDQLRDTVEIYSRDLISTARSQSLTLASQAENARTAAYALSMAERQYRGGTISMLEVNDAEVTYLNAQLAYLQAIYEYFSSTLQLLKLLSN